MDETRGAGGHLRVRPGRARAGHARRQRGNAHGRGGECPSSSSPFPKGWRGSKEPAAARPPRADCEPGLGPALLPPFHPLARSSSPTRPPALRPRGLAPQPLIDAVTAGLLAGCNHFVIQQRVKVAEAMTMGCYQVSSGMTTRRHAAAPGGGEGADAPATSKRTRTTSSTGTRTRRSSRSRRSRTTARGAAAVSPPGRRREGAGADRRPTPPPLPPKRPETPKPRATPCSSPSSA